MKCPLSRAFQAECRILSLDIYIYMYLTHKLISIHIYIHIDVFLYLVVHVVSRILVIRWSLEAPKYDL